MNNIVKFRISSNRVLEEIEKYRAATNKPVAKIVNEMLEKSLGLDETILQLKKINDSLQSIDSLALNVDRRIKTLSSWAIQNFVYINAVLETLRLYFKSQNLDTNKLFPPKNFQIRNTYLMEKFDIEKVLDFIKEIESKE